MPRTNDRINPKFHHSAILVVGCQRAQSERNRNEYFSQRTQNCFPALALAAGRYAMNVKILLISLLVIGFITKPSIVRAQGGNEFEERFFVNDTEIDLQAKQCFEIPVVKSSVIDSFNSNKSVIHKLSAEGHNLYLDVYYGGGCGTVKLYVVFSDEYSSSNDSIELQSYFEDYDSCKAVKARRVCIDMSAILKKRSDPLTVILGELSIIITPH